MARKVNKRFLIILTVTVLTSLCVLVGVLFFLPSLGSDPRPHVIAGDQALAKGLENLAKELKAVLIESRARAAVLADSSAQASANRDLEIEARGQLRKGAADELRAAVNSYAMAYRYDRRNVATMVKLGMAQMLSSRFEPDSVTAAVKTLESAIEIDPLCEPALSELVNTYLDYAETLQPQSYAKLQDRAAALAAATSIITVADADHMIDALGRDVCPEPVSSAFREGERLQFLPSGATATFAAMVGGEKMRLREISGSIVAGDTLVGNASGKLAKVVETDRSRHARALERAAIIGQWLNNQSLPQERVEAAIVALERMGYARSEDWRDLAHGRVPALPLGWSTKFAEWRIPRYIAMACLEMSSRVRPASAAEAAEWDARAERAFVMARRAQEPTLELLGAEHRLLSGLIGSDLRASDRLRSRDMNEYLEALRQRARAMATELEKAQQAGRALEPAAMKLAEDLKELHLRIARVDRRWKRSEAALAQARDMARAIDTESALNQRCDEVLALINTGRAEQGRQVLEDLLRSTAIAVTMQIEETQGMDTDNARRILADLLNRHWHNVQVRIELATHMARRQGQPISAVAPLLSDETLDDPALIGVRSRIRSYYDYLQLRTLVQLRIEAYDPTAASAEQRKLIEQGLVRIEAMQPQDPIVMRLRAQATLLDPTPQARLEAVRILEKARPLARAARDRHEISLALADVYQKMGQTGEARKLLQDVLASQPADAFTRLALAEILLGARMYEEAKPHVEALAQEYGPGTDAQGAIQDRVTRLNVTLLWGLGKKDEALKLAQTLLEDTRASRTRKGAILLSLGDAAGSEKLLARSSEEELTATATENASLPATELLVQHFVGTGRKQQARELVDRVIALRPEDRRWPVILKIIEGKATREEIVAARLELLEERQAQMARTLSDAVRLHREGKTDEALADLQDAEAKDPGNVQLLAMMFDIALQKGNAQGDWSVAERACEKLAASGIDQANGMSFRAMLKLARGDAAGALADAVALTEKAGELANNWVVRGRAEKALGRYEEAISSFEKALQKQLGNREALIGLIDCHGRFGRIELARQLIQEGKRGPYRQEFLDRENELEESEGDPRVATKRREDARDANPDNVLTWHALYKNYRKVSERARGAGNDAEAVAYLTKSEETIRQALEKWPDDLKLLATYDVLAFQVNHSDQSFARLTAALASEAGRNDPHLRVILSDHYRRKAQLVLSEKRDQVAAQAALAEAEKALLQAIELGKGNSIYELALAQFYEGVGQRDRGIDVLQQLHRRTKDVEHCRTLVTALINANKAAEADELIVAAIKANPQDLSLQSLQSYIKMKRGDSAAAMEILNRLLDRDPGYGTALYYRGVLRGSTGDLAGGMADLQKAKESNPNDPDYRLALAEALLRRGQAPQATKELEEALALAPERPDVRYRLIQTCLLERQWIPAQRLINEAKENTELAGNPIWLRLEAQMWYARQDTQRALAAIQGAIKLAPDELESQVLLLELLASVRQFELMIKVTDSLQDVPATNWPWQMHMYRAIALRALGKASEAETWFDAALSCIDAARDDAAAPQLTANMEKVMGSAWTARRLVARRAPRWMIELMQVHLRAGEAAQAVAVADQVIAELLDKLTPPQRRIALRSAGMVYAATATSVPGAGEKATQAYFSYLEEIEKRGGDVFLRVEALNNLACLLAEHPTTPDPAKALLYSQKAWEITTRSGQPDPNIADTHGWVLVLCGKVDEGIAILRQATDSPAANAPPEAFYHLGMACLRQSKTADAERSFIRAQEQIQRLAERSARVDPSLAPKVKAELDKLSGAKSSAGTGG